MTCYNLALWESSGSPWPEWIFDIEAASPWDAVLLAMQQIGRTEMFKASVNLPMPGGKARGEGFARWYRIQLEDDESQDR